MSTDYVLGIVLGAGDKAENKPRNMCPHQACVCIFSNYINGITLHTAHSTICFSGSTSNFWHVSHMLILLVLTDV